jgi:hypothetical protein
MAGESAWQLEILRNVSSDSTAIRTTAQETRDE